MARPHAHLDRERSAVEVKRISLGLTLDRGAALTQGRVSRSAWHRLERYGRGSLEAWEQVAAVLGMNVDQLRGIPARGSFLAGQLELPGWASSS